jgi:hypothetical protein
MSLDFIARERTVAVQAAAAAQGMLKAATKAAAVRWALETIVVTPAAAERVLAAAVAAVALTAKASGVKKVSAALVAAASTSSKGPQWNGFSWLVLGDMALGKVLAARGTREQSAGGRKASRDPRASQRGGRVV